MNQKQRLLTYLKTHGNITPLEAWVELSIYRLADVVLKLRKDGWNITTGTLKVHNKFGELCKFARYQLVE